MIREINKRDYYLIENIGHLINDSFKIDKISDNEIIVVYEEENKIKGFIEYSKLYETVELINIAVLPEYRNMSIGTKLVDYLTNLDGAEYIMLEVRVSNLNAISFYEMNGFKVIRKIKNYYDNEDALVMQKVIL